MPTHSRSCCDFHYVKAKNTEVLQYNDVGSHNFEAKNIYPKQWVQNKPQMTLLAQAPAP